MGELADKLRYAMQDGTIRTEILGTAKLILEGCDGVIEYETEKIGLRCGQFGNGHGLAGEQRLVHFQLALDQLRIGGDAVDTWTKAVQKLGEGAIGRVDTRVDVVTAAGAEATRAAVRISSIIATTRSSAAAMS